MDKNYFIKKFAAIPEEKWCEGDLDRGDGCHCALGHCGVKQNGGQWETTEEADALMEILAPAFSHKIVGDTPRFGYVWGVNDGHRGDLYNQFKKLIRPNNPKQNIINILNAL